MLETASNLWGRTVNPFNTLLSAGGSSGGEGALVGCLGSPLGVGTDIGGSIRAPCAYNGLYGLKPSSRRISYAGINTTLNGQIAMLAVAGPMGRSVRDLSLFTEVLCTDEHWLKDPSVVERGWVAHEVPSNSKVKIGVMRWDEVVMPHPPIQRAIARAVEQLKEAGHEGMFPSRREGRYPGFV
jgi:amidase